MASASYQSLQEHGGDIVDVNKNIRLRRSSPVLSKVTPPRITKLEAVSCTDLTKLQPEPHYQKGHVRASSTSPSFTVRFRKKKTVKNATDIRPKSLLVLNSNDMRKSSNASDTCMSLIEALHDKKLRVGFRIFLESEFSVENLDFWLAVDEYKKITNVETRKAKAMEIYQEFISPGAPNQINVDHFTRNQVIQHMASDSSPCPDTFTAAQRYIFNIMENDSYARFVRSKYYDICNVPGRRSPRRFLYDILHGGKSRDRSQSPPKRSSNNNNNNVKLNKSDSNISSTPGCYCMVYVKR